jgi:hypothetical protein
VSPGLVVYRYWLRRLQGILTQLRQAGTRLACLHVAVDLRLALVRHSAKQVDFVRLAPKFVATPSGPGNSNDG